MCRWSAEDEDEDEDATTAPPSRLLPGRALRLRIIGAVARAAAAATKMARRSANVNRLFAAAFRNALTYLANACRGTKRSLSRKETAL